MLNITFLFGTLAGLIVAAGLLAGIALLNPEHAAGSEWFGYLVMILALSMIFFGIKRYRDREGGGVIKFVPAFLLGGGIAAVAGVIYVAVWEVYLAATHYAFMDLYINAMIATKKAQGVSGPALDAVVSQMQTLKAQYANPLFRVPMTFLEIFPVGLAIAVISAAILRNSKVLPERA